VFQFIPVHEDNIFAIRISGKLTHEDYQQFLPKLENLLKTEKNISLLIELDNFQGAKLEAIKDDFNFTRTHQEDFEKVAIVGDKQWQKWITLLSKPLLKGDVKYFSHTALQDAWDWLRERNLSNDELANIPTMPYKKIMVAMDFSAHSVRAARRAIDIAKHFKSQLQLVYVVDESAYYDLYTEPGDIGFMMNMMTDHSIQALGETNKLLDSMVYKAREDMNAMLKKLDLDQTQGIVLTGKPNTTLISYIEAQNIDLAVMGTHGKHGFDAVLGSSTLYVQSRARCDVLAVPLV